MRVESPKPEALLPKHWWRLKRSLGRRWREWRLPRGFERLGTKYGGWWVYAPAVGRDPLLIDCGLGTDISFPRAFLERFGGRAIGIDPNPQALDYCRRNCPAEMDIRDAAFWKHSGATLTFHLPRAREQLPNGADGVSGSLLASHSYAGEEKRTVRTTSLREVLWSVDRAECDVLKLDVEGAEYEVLHELARSGELRRVRQLLVEFHHHCTDRTLEDTLRTISEIQENGFVLRHTEDRNAVFLRRDVEHGA